MAKMAQVLTVVLPTSLVQDVLSRLLPLSLQQLMKAQGRCLGPGAMEVGGGGREGRRSMVFLLRALLAKSGTGLR